MHNYTWQQTHVAYDYTTHQMTTLLPMMHCFIRTKFYVTAYKLLQFMVCTYALQCLSNYSGCYKLILTLIRSTTVLLDKLTKHTCNGTCTLQRVCCHAVKKKQKLWVKIFLEKLTTCRDGPIKSTETQQGLKKAQDYPTTQKIVVKEDQKIALCLLPDSHMQQM